MNRIPMRSSSPPRVLILGAGANAEKLHREIVDSLPHIPYSVIGFSPLEECDNKLPENLILKSEETLLQIARRTKASEIVVVQDSSAQQLPMQQLLDCKLSGIKLSCAESFLEVARNKYSTQEMGPILTLDY